MWKGMKQPGGVECLRKGHVFLLFTVGGVRCAERDRQYENHTVSVEKAHTDTHTLFVFSTEFLRCFPAVSMSLQAVSTGQRLYMSSSCSSVYFLAN